MRKLKLFILVATALCALPLLAACGGGGGGGGGGSSSPGSGQGPTGTGSGVVGGVASLGPINNGIIKVYKLNTDKTPGDLLGSSQTGEDGTYPGINIGSYTGAILVELTGATDGSTKYKDEATRQWLDFPTSLKLRATTTVSGNDVVIQVAVTALTETAYQLFSKSGSTLTVDQANTLVGTMMGGIDVIKTMPVDVTESSSSQGTDQQKNYGLALAALSQVIHNGGADSVSSAIQALTDDIADDNKLGDTGQNLSNSLTDFLSGQNNQSGVTTTQTNLDNLIDWFTSHQIDASEFASVSAADELVANVSPELTGITHMIANVVRRAITCIPGDAPATGYPYPPYTTDVSGLTVSGDVTTVGLTIEKVDGNISSAYATATVTFRDNGSGGMVGHVALTGSTLSIDADYTLQYNQDSTSQWYTFALTEGSVTSSAISLTFAGSDEFSATCDFDDPTNDQLPIHPTSIKLAGVAIATPTRQFDGTLTIPATTWQAGGEASPASAGFDGTFKELPDGTPSNLSF